MLGFTSSEWAIRFDRQTDAENMLIALRAVLPDLFNGTEETVELAWY
jgi:hypothetical protein